MIDLKELRTNAQNFNVLYVEDNHKLRENAFKFLKKFFKNVYLAKDGEEGFETFKKVKPHIVITDIKMPKLNGIELTKKIKQLNQNIQIIIMSAFDDSEYLFSSIEYGVFRYLKKPVNISDFAKILFECVSNIKKVQDEKIFQIHLENVFNYQSSMVVMMQHNRPIFANQMFLEYFEIESIEEFLQKYEDFGNIFLKHDGFLYNKENKNWFEEIGQHSEKLYNVKIKNKEDELRHFILKYQYIPNKDSYGILSFDDITELNLLKLFDEKATDRDAQVKNSKDLFKFLKVIQRNNAKIEVHNYYKGLSITNDSIISQLTEDSVTIKTKFMQQKAIQITKQTLLLSDALPHAIECKNIADINFEKQSVKLKDLYFVKTSPIKRKTIRMTPDEKHTVSMFLDGTKIHSEIKIEDISLDAIRINIDLVPPHLNEESEVVLDIVLELDKKPLIINTKATLLRKIELKHSYSMVFLFQDLNTSDLVKYITKRQMAVIREFKGLQNG
jgi:DNA-binding NarL/FixJ family response regulator